MVVIDLIESADGSAIISLGTADGSAVSVLEKGGGGSLARSKNASTISGGIGGIPTVRDRLTNSL